MKTRSRISALEDRIIRTLYLFRSVGFWIFSGIPLQKQRYRLSSGRRVIHQEQAYWTQMLSPLIKKGDVTNHTFSGKRVRRGLYKTNSGLFINADINGAGNILRKEYPSAFDGQELSYLYETTKVVSYTDIYIGAKSLCNERYNGKNHQSGMGSRANHQYRKERRHHYRSLWGKSRAA